jgi:cytochrome c biogenesis protein CcmG, thiol:disulfide interchange protein DsbE
MNRRMLTREFLKKWTPSPVTLLLLGLIAYVWFRPPAWVEEISQPAPDVPTVPGQRLADLRGQVVLVNFWATWCPYCRHEMPAMQEYFAAHQHQGFTIVAYSEDESQAIVDDFMRKEGYTFAAPLTPAGVSAAFGGVSRLPTSFIIDRKGHIRHKISGQVHYGRLEDLVGPLLAE